SRGWLALLIGLLVAPWLIIAAMLLSGSHESKQASVTNPRVTAAAVAEDTALAHPGPWGRLTYLPLVISPPVEYIDRLDPGHVVSAWHFNDMDPRQLAEFLAQAGVPAALVDRIMAVAKPMEPPAVGQIVMPDDGIVHELSPASR